MEIQSISRELKSRITFPSLILDDLYIKEFEYSGSLLTKDEFEIGTSPAMRLKIDSQGYFTTTDFLEAHAENYRYKPLFNHNNVKNYILSYSESKGLNLSQDNRRRWTSSISGDEVSDDLPF